ncbi:pseudouridine synthase [Nitzschia inconspicua]|uniref:Pseudouridine synthase n=1 Tax=Nitzschia inconspicua TaxID=303405 RepID=A0A9K3LMJ5_9STRA|nr:pseudouridine synthase [Nitzschia inconspicua]
MFSFLACSVRSWTTSYINGNLKAALNRHPSVRLLSFSTTVPSTTDSTDNNTDGPFLFNGTVAILEKGEHYVVVDKPSGVVCHHSDWSGSRKRKRLDRQPEVPMLQRAREAVGERVNLIHRLDRGASGCLLLSLAKSDENGGNVTAILQDTMMKRTTKTYLALVRGEGILKGRNFRKEGWFRVDRPIKDELGTLKNATSYFRFIAGQDNANGTLVDRPRASLVLARIETGRWHQIRKHLNGLSHPIIGDSSHGNSKTNREWRERWGLIPERTCLHLLHLQLPSTEACPQGISVTSSVAPDIMHMLQNHFLPDVLEEALTSLREEGLSLESSQESTVVEIQLELP